MSNLIYNTKSSAVTDGVFFKPLNSLFIQIDLSLMKMLSIFYVSFFNY